MKIFFSLMVLVCFGWGAELDMPPSIPVLKPEGTGTNTKTINSCDVLPPMLYMLPPPLQGELDSCINEKNKPSQDSVKQYLDKNKIKYKDLKISLAKDFVRLYEIDLGSKKVMYCNEKVTKCFEVK